MSPALDVLPPSPLPSSSGLVVLAVVWAGALAAAAAVILRQISTLASLREELEAVKQAASPRLTSAAADGGPSMFGALYQTRPGMLERLRAVPVPALVAIATVLTGLGGALLIRRAEQVRAVAVGQGAEITKARAAYDSLSTMLSRFRDSVASVRAAPPAVEVRRSPPPSARPARVARSDAAAASRATLPPPPALDPAPPASR